MKNKIFFTLILLVPFLLTAAPAENCQISPNACITFDVPEGSSLLHVSFRNKSSEVLRCRISSTAGGSYYFTLISLAGPFTQQFVTEPTQVSWKCWPESVAHGWPKNGKR